MARVTIVLALLLLGGCVSNGDDNRSELASTPSPRRYDADPDKQKQVCESTTEGTESKTICY